MAGTGEVQRIVFLSNAQLAHHLSMIARLIAGAQVSLAEGLWNPEFCSADATYYARSVCDDLRHKLSEIEQKL